MPVDCNHFIKTLAKICDEKDIKCCIRECIKGGLLTGFSTMIGGFLLGPAGLAIGALVGGTASALSSSQKFQPLSTILINLPAQKKQKLINHLQLAFKNLETTDLINLAGIIMSSNSLKELAIREVKNYLTKEMSITYL